MLKFLRSLLGNRGADGASSPGAVLHLTPAAAAEMKLIAQQQGLAPHWSLRVAIRVTPDAIGGWRYDQDMIEEPPHADDAVFESHGVRVFVDAWSRQHLMGTVIDFAVTPEGKGFTFKNPNAVRPKR